MTKDDLKVLKKDSQRHDISSEAYDLLQGLLEVDPNKRISLEECLKHQWISNENFYHQKVFFKKMTFQDNDSKESP